MYTGIFTYPLFVVLTTACFIAGFIDCVFLILLIFTYFIIDFIVRFIDCLIVH